MKILLAVVLAFFACATAQIDETLTRGLLDSQADLALGHEFFETAMFLNRGQISAYMYRINRELIDSHINAYSTMKTQILAINEELDSMDVTEGNEVCLNSVRNRFDLQVTRFGHRLSSCIDVAFRMLTAWNRFLLDIHATGQLSANQVQNIGNKILSETDIFDGRENYLRNINREYRMLLGLVLPYRSRFDGFLADISRTATEVIGLLADCDRELEEDFALETENDLTRARNC